MRYLIFETFEVAQSTERVIFQRGAAIAQSIGYELTDTGAIVGERDGKPDPIGLTTAWAHPQQRSDGRWALLHPEAHPDASNPAWLAFVMKDIEAPVEVENESWW